jgi:hypothetical protein
VRAHKETHSNNFKDHFKGINIQEYKINGFIVGSDNIYLFIESKKTALYLDHEENNSFKPGIYSN